MEAPRTGVIIALCALLSSLPLVVGAEPPAEKMPIPPEGDGYDKRVNAPGHADTGTRGASFDYSFSDLDTNDNDVVSRSEASSNPQLAAEFSRFDANNDLMLNAQEYRQYERWRMSRARSR